MSEAIRLIGLSKTYLTLDNTPVTALSEVNFGIERGQFVSLLGPSGCGKSTCLRIVDGVIDPDPGGQVLLHGKPVLGPGFDRARIFQSFALLPWKTVRENVELGLRWRGAPAVERRKVSDRYLEMIGLTAFAGKYPSELSGGMKQRVGIARALALDPDILLADEPFASVDALTREVLQDELLLIWSDTKKTVLFVTHSIEEAIYLSDRIIVFSGSPGRVVADIQVPLARPREHRMKESPEFGRLREEIWSKHLSRSAGEAVVET